MAERGVPGMIVAVQQGAAVPDILVIGTDAAGAELSATTLFPLASVTKLATALALLRLVADGAAALDDPLRRHAPDAAAATDEAVTLRRLLCHTAGLPSDVAQSMAAYRPGLSWHILADACLQTPLSMAPQTRVHYSNVGIGLAALVVERLMGRPFPVALRELVLQPLGIEGELGDVLPRPPAAIGGALGDHAGTSLEPFNSPFWRSLAMPWAGLVTDAAGVLRLLDAFAGQAPDFLPPDQAAEATCDQTGGLGGGLFGPLVWPACPWGLGPELRGRKQPHPTPEIASDASFGHIGASGCLAWHDPTVGEGGLSWVILGPRTFESWWRKWPLLGEAVLGSTD